MWAQRKLFFSYTPHPVRQQILPAPPSKSASTGLIPLPWLLGLFVSFLRISLLTGLLLCRLPFVVTQQL